MSLVIKIKYTKIYDQIPVFTYFSSFLIYPSETLASGSCTATVSPSSVQTSTDTGRGIPPENQGLLFRKFQQAGSSLYTRDTTKGTGLGLYISKLMIEGMGGKIWLENREIDKGTTFAFCLPIVDKKQIQI
jgi:hypothetical protein